MDLAAILAEADRLVAQGRPAPRARPVPDVRALMAQADALVLGQKRARERRRKAEARERHVEEISGLWAAQTREKADEDFCVIRLEAVRGIPEFQLAACRVEFDERRPGERQPHVHGGRVPCVQTRQCYRCGAALKNGQRRWCTRECSTIWWTNHMWSMASGAALKRDGYACVKCGRKVGEEIAPGLCSIDGEAWVCGAAEEVALVKGLTRLDLGVFVTLPGERATFHQPLERRLVTLEVNHMDPLVGRGYDAGCVHHIDRLETLCHDCHVVETNRQAAERRAARG